MVSCDFTHSPRAVTSTFTYLKFAATSSRGHDKKIPAPRTIMSKHTGDSESQMSEATRAPEVTRIPEHGSATSDTDKEPHMTTSQYREYFEETGSKYGKGDDDRFKMARRLLLRADLPAPFKAGCHGIRARGDDKPVQEGVFLTLKVF